MCILPAIRAPSKIVHLNDRYRLITVNKSRYQDISHTPSIILLLWSVWLHTWPTGFSALWTLPAICRHSCFVLQTAAVQRDRADGSHNLLAQHATHDYDKGTDQTLQHQRPPAPPRPAQIHAWQHNMSAELFSQRFHHQHEKTNTAVTFRNVIV